MTCRMCGNELPDGAVICLLCGTLVHPLIDWDKRKQRRKERLMKRQEWMEPNTEWEEGASSPQDGRIPYGAGPSVSAAEAQAYRSQGANLALLLGIVGCVSLLVPWLSLPLGMMAILFGALGLHRGEYHRNRAVTGIVIGVCLVLLSSTLILCLSALRPYQEDLIRIVNEYMQHLR